MTTYNFDMQEWLRISIFLCLFGFLKEFRPSEPFVYEFLDGPWRNLTEQQINEDVYPIETYSYLAQLVVIFLITDMCRYKPLIIVLGLSGIVIWSMLIWTTSLISLQIIEFFYGTLIATEVAYYTYIYAKVDIKYYEKVTSHTRASALAGRAISSILGQILISFKFMDYKQLNYISLAALTLATVWAILLPPAGKTIYFHRNSDEEAIEDNRTFCQKSREAFSLMKKHFVESFTNVYIIKWSLWWSLSSCGFYQVQNYMQALWTVIRKDSKQNNYNGGVEATLTILGTGTALLAGFLKINWSKHGEFYIAFGGTICGVFVILCMLTSNVYIAYVGYILFGALYHFMITVSSSEIAKVINEDSFGLIFGFNTFIATILQTIITVLVVSGKVNIHLSIKNQYLVYGIYFISISVVYFSVGLFNLYRRFCKSESQSE